MVLLEEIRNQFGKILTSRRPRGPSRNRRGIVECLEVRALLATFSVTNLHDAGTGSLRDAIGQANSTLGADEIVIETSGQITLSTGHMQISDSLTITGPGSSLLAISGNNTAH